MAMAKADEVESILVGVSRKNRKLSLRTSVVVGESARSCLHWTFDKSTRILRALFVVL